IALENITIYFKDEIKDTEIKELSIISLDSVTDLHLKMVLSEYYLNKANSFLREIKYKREEIEMAMDILNLMKNMRNNEYEISKYKREVEEGLKESEILVDSAKYYTDLSKKLAHMETDTIKPIYYNARIKYNLVEKNKKALEGEIELPLNLDLNIVDDNQIINDAKRRFLNK